MKWVFRGSTAIGNLWAGGCSGGALLPSTPHLHRAQRDHHEKKEGAGGTEIFQDPAVFEMLQIQPSPLQAPKNSTPQEAWQNGGGMESSVTSFAHCLG